MLITYPLIFRHRYDILYYANPRKDKEMITEEEIKSATDRFNSLQRSAYGGGLTKAEKEEWKTLSLHMRSNGYSLHKRKQEVEGYGKISVWRLVKDSDIKRNSEAPYEFTNMRPNHKTLHGDCTTRAMAFCLKGIMTYDEIEAEQYRLAKEYGTKRNTTKTWPIVIYGYDYIKVQLWDRVKRSRLASIVGNCITAPIITLSTGHVAVVDCGGIVRDIWDSRGGKVKAIFIKKHDIEPVVTALLLNGIECY